MEFVVEKKVTVVWIHVCVCVCVRTRMKKTFLRMCKGVCFSSRV